jgi:hypothetical protein
MLSRRQVLGVSVVAAAAAHALLIALSPRLPVLQARSAPAKEYSVFRVQIVDDLSAPPPRTAGPIDADSPVAAPGAIEDLLTRELESLTPSDSLLQEMVEIPNIDDRIASDPVDREHSLEPDPDVLSAVDAKILEISQESARDDIQVARREVAPSANRLLGPNEFPVLRSQFDDVPAEVLMVEPRFTPPSAPAGLGQPLALDEGPLETPPFEAGVLAPDPAEGLPELPEELQVARAPIREEIRSQSKSEFIDELVDITINTYVPPGETQGYFSLQITPRADRQIEVLPKDVTFVIDASSSIMQQKLTKTIRGVSGSVQMLRPEDHFNIVIFRDSATSFRPDPVPATREHIAEAVRFLEGQQSRGGTDVYQAIAPIIDAPTRHGIPGMVLVLSDGRPTTGVRDGRTIINALTADNADNKSIFAAGGGNTVNRYLLDLLAYRNKGESFVASNFNTLDNDLPRFFAAFNDPLLTNLQADYGRVSEEEVYPKAVPDFFRGKAVNVFGRFDPQRDHEFVMRLAGQAGPKHKEVVFKADLREAMTGDVNIARNWAFQKIYYLIGEICRVGERPELLAELRALSRQYNIRTSYSE